MFKTDLIMKIDPRKTLKNVSLMIMMLQMCFVFSQKKVIVIDVGHGGKDTGAVGINGIQEKEVVLNVAKEILNLNKTVLNNRFDIYLTRYKDTLVSLFDRSRLAKVLKTDVFVSLHCNTSQTTSRGMEFYVHNSANLNSKESISLGVHILNESALKLDFEERGAKFADFQVLRETTAICPAILVEMGFLTNANEANYFLNPKKTRAMALAILLGITNYLNIVL